MAEQPSIELEQLRTFQVPTIDIKQVNDLVMV